MVTVLWCLLAAILGGLWGALLTTRTLSLFVIDRHYDYHSWLWREEWRLYPWRLYALCVLAWLATGGFIAYAVSPLF
jgi:hypothetical protein